MRPTPGCGALHLRAYIRASMQRLHVSRARAWILYTHTRAQKRCADECACMLSKRKMRECSPAWGSLAPQRNEDTHASRNEGRKFRAPSLLIRVQTRCSRAMLPPLSWPRSPAKQYFPREYLACTHGAKICIVSADCAAQACNCAPPGRP